MNRTRSLWNFILSALILICAACGNPRAEIVAPDTPPEAAHIRGTITDIFTTGEHINAIFVDGTALDNQDYDRASVQIVAETRIFRQRGPDYEVVASEQLTVGLQVSIVFTGEILERYPPAATAGEIIILSDED